MRAIFVSSLLAAFLLSPGAALGQIAAPASPVIQPAPAAPAVQAGTLVDIVILDHLNSKTSHIGDSFRIGLAQPILLDGRIMVPAGVEGRGEIIHVARARAAGKAGEMILAARTLDWNGRTIRLRAFAFGQSGQSRVTEGAVMGLVAGPVGFLIAGGEVDVPSGAQAHAKLAEAISLETPLPSSGAQ